MPILTKAQLEALNQSSFPDNTTGAITPQILRTYNTQTIDTLVDSLDTGSFVTSAITGSSLVTASFSGNTLTFTKGNGTQFGVVIPDVSGSTINTGSFATTGSNVFVGNQTISGSGTKNGITFKSGSEFFVGQNEVGRFVISSSVQNRWLELNNDNGFAEVYAQTVNFNNNVNLRSRTEARTFVQEAGYPLVINGTLSASLQNGYAFVGGADGYSKQVPTSSFAGAVPVGVATTGSNIFIGDQTITGSVNLSGGEHLFIKRSTAGADNLLRLGATDNGNNFAFIVTGSDTNPSQQVWGINTAGGIWGNSFDAGVVFNSFVTASAGLRIQSAGTFSAPLQQGYVWVGDSTGRNTTVPTSSFAGGTINTGSFATTGSNTFNGNQTINGEVRAQGATPYFTAAGNSANSGAQFPTHDVIITNNNNEFGGFGIYKEGNYPNTTFAGLVATAYSPQYGGTTVPMIIANGNNPSGSDTAIAWTSDGNAEHWKKSNFKFGIDVTGSINSTGNNSFLGDLTLKDATGNSVTLTDVSGSLMLVAKSFTSASAHISASTATQVNLIFKNNNNTADTIVSGSNNIFVNPAAPTAGFKRYVGSTGNIILNVNSTPQISGSMGFSPTMNNNIWTGAGVTMRGPVSSSAWTISNNIGNATAHAIGTADATPANQVISGLTISQNIGSGFAQITGYKTPLSASVTYSSNLNASAPVQLNCDSSSIAYSGNISSGQVTINNSYLPGTINSTSGVISVGTNNIFGTTIINASGSNTTFTGAPRAASFNIIGGYSTIGLVLNGDNSSLNSTAVIGGGLVVTGSNSRVTGATANNDFGSAFFGRWNDINGNKDLSAETVFAVGTGTSTTRKTGFLIDSGSNTFIEGTLNVSGSTSVTGSFRALIPTASNESTIDLFRLPTFVASNGTTYNQAGIGLLDYASSAIDQTFGIEYANSTFEKYSALYVGPSRTQFIVGTGTGFDYDVIELLDNNNNTTTAKVKADTVILQGAIQATGSITIQSGSGDLYVHGNKQFNVGAFTSTITQSGSAAVSQSMTFNTTDITQGVTLNGGGTQLTLTNSGTYNIQFSAQVLADTGADTVWIWLKKNGTNVSNTATKLVLANNEANVAAWNFVVPAVGTDYFELAWQSSGGHTKLFAETAAGNYPAIPSVIVTVTQVR